ncbi:MAG: NAD(+)/NADH kinase [Gammaproteobacteria bacterium]
MKQALFRRVGLFSKAADPAAGSVLAEVVRMLRAAGCEIMPTANAAALVPDAAACEPTDVKARADLAIVIGGDGSMLAAARALDWAAVPLIGVNRGRIGFLADVRSGALAEELGAVLRGDYMEERRSVLAIEADGGTLHTDHAVNDVVIKRRDGSRVLEVEVWVGDAWFGRTRGDGLIVATPTGSTAYALSAGGAIIAPGLDALAIVPICPHSLGERPALVPDVHPIRLRPLLADGETAEAVLDGQASFLLSANQELRVRRAEHELLLVHPPTYEYFATLREKLDWGGRAPTC